MFRKLAILGSTGSIGQQTLDVVRCFPEKFSVSVLSAGKNIELLKQQILEFKPIFVCVQSKENASLVRQFIGRQGLKIDVKQGPQGLLAAVQDYELDMVVVAIMGTTALAPTVAAIRQKIPIALACKEVLVSAGTLIMSLAKQLNVPILPIDSEHSAMKQTLEGINENVDLIDTVILTASGGPFRMLPLSEFNNIQAEDALKHPNWDMGGKITIDSATLMNKGLEIIEAHHLFSIPFEKLSAIIHPTSMVHCITQFTDGSSLAQLSVPDMRIPIQSAILWPEKHASAWPKLSILEMQKCEFFPIDHKRFPLFQLALDAGKAGGAAPVVLNAANEAAVHLFLKKKIPFQDIYNIVSDQLSAHSTEVLTDVTAVIELDLKIKQTVYEKKDII